MNTNELKNPLLVCACVHACVCMCVCVQIVAGGSLTIANERNPSKLLVCSP